MNKYNLDKLVKVRVYDFHPSTSYIFMKEKKAKYFWQDSCEEGVYKSFGGLVSKGIKTPENHVIKDGIVFEKPEVTMYLQGGISTTKYFETLIESEEFANSITTGKNWLLN